MSSLKIFVISQGNVKKSVALYSGIDISEVVDLLQTVFNLSDPVIGFQTDDGLVVPISLVCKNPNVLPDDSTISLVLPKKSISPSSTGPESFKQQSVDKIPIASEVSTDTSEIQQLSSKVNQEIHRILSDFKSKGILSSHQFDALCYLQSCDSLVLTAAFSVALSANDAEYLAEIFRDVASSLETDEGRSACEAQDEVLQIADQLFSRQNISESQLLYLRHLILIRDESVADIYDIFQDDYDIEKLAKNLYELVHTHPYQNQSESIEYPKGKNAKLSENFDSKPSASVEKAVESDADKATRIAEESMEEIKYIIKNTIMNLLSNKKLTSDQAAILVELVEEENDALIEGFTFYEDNEDSSQFFDFIANCIDFALERKQQDDTLEQGDGQGNDNDEEANNQEDDNEFDNDKDDKVVVDGNTEEEQERDQLLLSLLSAAKVADRGWLDTVPKSFIILVFSIGVMKPMNLLTVDDAIALCDLYKSGYDMLLAAWEVYCVQDDLVDLVDTLQRIIRDVNNTSKNTSTTDDAETNAEPKSDGKAPATEESAEERKSKALAAVQVAKRELLKHSLEMMVKQGLLESEAAVGLFRRCLEGDQLVDAAIEAYASDRNVAEFLDTLFILASHTQKELNDLLNQNREKASNENANTSDASKEPEVSTSDDVVEDSIVKRETKIFIRQLIIELTQHNLLPAEIATTLLSLLASTSESAGESDIDERILAVYEIYEENKDLTDFIDSLLRIGRFEILKSSSKSNSPNVSNKSSPVHAKESGTLASSPAPVNSKESKDVNSSPTRSPLVTKTSVVSPASIGSDDARFDESIDVDGDDDDDDDDEDEDDDDPIVISPTKTTINNTSAANSDVDYTPILMPPDQKNIVQLVAGTMDLTHDDVSRLYSLIDETSPLIADIFKNYELNRNTDILRQSIKSLVDKLKESSGYATSGQTKKQPLNEDAGKGSILGPNDQTTIVRLLASSNTISAGQLQILQTLIDKRDSSLSQVFLQYERDTDVTKLLENLYTILSESSFVTGDNSSGDETTTRVWSNGPIIKQKDLERDEEDDVDEEAEEEEDDIDDDYDDEDDEDGLDEEDKETIDEKFLDIIQAMKINDLESAALRLAIAKGSIDIKEALSVYKFNQDDYELQLALRDVIKKTIEETKLTDDKENDIDEEEEEEDDGDDDEAGQGDDEEYFRDALNPNEDEDDYEAGKYSSGFNYRAAYELDADLYEGISQEDKDFLKSRGWNMRTTATAYGSTNTSSPTRTTSSAPSSSTSDIKSQAQNSASKSTPVIVPSPSTLNKTQASSPAIYRRSIVGSAEKKLSNNEVKSDYKYTNDAYDDEEAEDEGDDNEDDEDEDDNEDDEDDDNNEDDDNDDGHEDEDDNGEDEDDDEDYEDDLEDSAITSTSARNHIFPLLLNELVKESMLSSNDSDLLLREYSSGSTTVNAALDVYDLDADMGELVDTLQRTAKAIKDNRN